MEREHTRHTDRFRRITDRNGLASASPACCQRLAPGRSRLAREPRDATSMLSVIRHGGSSSQRIRHKGAAARGNGKTRKGKNWSGGSTLLLSPGNRIGCFSVRRPAKADQPERRRRAKGYAGDMIHRCTIQVTAMDRCRDKSGLGYIGKLSSSSGSWICSVGTLQLAHSMPFLC